MRNWDDKEKRDSNQEEFNRRVGKFLLISATVGLTYYLAIYL